MFCFEIYKFAGVMKSTEPMSPHVRSVINKETFPLWGEFDSNGVRVRCVPRDRDVSHQEACSGCYFVDKHCPKSQCSSFGRTDGMNVWFVEVSKL